jgi:hypothetical protein
MMGDGHIDFDAGVHCQSKVSRRSFDRVRMISDVALFLRISATIDIVIFAFDIREQWKVSEGWISSSAGIMQA